MKKVLIILILLTAGLLAYFIHPVFLNPDEFDTEYECFGFIHENECIDLNTPDSKLEKLGLIEKEENKKHEINVVYPRTVIKYPILLNHLKEQTGLIKEDFNFIKGSDDHADNTFRSLSIECDEYNYDVDYLSIICRFSEYTTGSNPNHGFFTTNYNTSTQTIIELYDLFTSKTKALRAISKYVIKQLYKEKSGRTGELIDTDEIIEDGASPKPGNYLNYIFVFESRELSGINFMFPNFQVGSQAEGPYEIVVPRKVFEEYIILKKLQDK